MAQRSARPTVLWATGAAILTLLVPGTIAASLGVSERSAFQPNRSASESTSSAALVPAARRRDPESLGAESRAGSRALGLATPVLFVAGPRKHVRFRVDLRDGTLGTPNTPKLLEGVVDVVVAERLLLLCQAQSGVASKPSLVGFDLETGVRIRDADREARAASIDTTFCAIQRPSLRSHSAQGLQGSPPWQNI